MRVFFPVIFSMIVIAILSAVEIVLLRKLHKEWWRYSWVRNLSYGIPLLGLFSLIAWVLGIILDSWLLTFTGATTTAAVFVFGVALMLSLPFSGIFHLLDRLIHVFQRSREKKRGEAATVVSAERRAFLRASAATFPVLAVTAGGSGLVASFQDPEMPVIPMLYTDLPEALEGFRILHLSDVHTGFFIGLENLERMAELSAQQRPDLILITGDFSDDRETYGDALRIVGQIPSRYGIYASIGNHEYFRGIKSIIRSYEKSTVPLLLDSGVELNVEGRSLYVGGADDPRSLSAMPEHFFERSVDRAMTGASADSFTVLMSHRPSGFDYAAAQGIDLTLAGHTHGGQIGFNGRSLLTSLNPERYMWGAYERGKSKLYVSAGAGHWFPYRLGCPAEIPTYVLTSGKA